MDSPELRFINNLSVLLGCGRPLKLSLEHMQADERDETLRAAYGEMVATLDKGGDFTAVLGDYPQLCSRSSLASVSRSSG